MTDPSSKSTGRAAEDRSLTFLPRESSEWLDFAAAHSHASTHRIIVAGTDAELSTFFARCPLLAQANAVAVTELSQAPALQEPHSPRAVLLLGTDEHWLQRQLMCLKDAANVHVCAAITPLYQTHRPVLVQSVPKSGTHLLMECLRGMGFRDPPSTDLPSPNDVLVDGHYYNLQHLRAMDLAMHYHRAAQFLAAFARSVVVFIVRDPRDMAVSLAHYLARESSYHVLSAWMRDHTQHERLTRVLSGGFPIPNFINRHFAFSGTIRDLVMSYAEWFRDPLPNMHFVSFEHLIGPEGGGCRDRQRQAIWELQLALHVPGSPGEFTDHIFSRDAATFRKGKIASFRDEFAPEHERMFRELPQDFMELTGYAIDRAPLDCRAPQNPSFTGVVQITTLMPQFLEPFRQFNLVYWRNQVYALDRRLGAVAIEKASADQHAAWRAGGQMFVADSLEAVKAELRSRGHAELTLLVENVRGFNIVGCNGRIIGVSQVLGPVYGSELDSRQARTWTANGQWLERATVDEVRHALETLPPRLIRPGFLGWNLIGWRGRILAVAVSRTPADLQDLEPPVVDELARDGACLTAASVSEIEQLCQREALLQLQQNLKAGELREATRLGLNELQDLQRRIDETRTELALAQAEIKSLRAGLEQSTAARYRRLLRRIVAAARARFARLIRPEIQPKPHERQ